MMELCSNLIKTPNTSAFIQRTYIYLVVDYFYLFQITQGFAIGKAWSTKGVIRSRKSKKDMQYNGQKNKQWSTHKTKIEQHKLHKKGNELRYTEDDIANM